MLNFTIWDTKANCDITINVGQTAAENWELIDNSDQNDLWFHVDKQPSPHVIIKVSKKCQISNQTIKYAASLCKLHSKYRNINKVSIIYTEIKHISKGEEVGSVTLKKKCNKLVI